MSLIRINREPSGRQLAGFGLAWLAFLGLAGARAWSRGHPAAAETAWILAAVVPLAGLARPRFLRQVYVGLSHATYPVGIVLSHILLALVYYLVLTPLGFTMRLFRPDPLCRRFDPDAPSYWTARDETKPPESYFNQR
jgi:hypothetical protein